MRQVTKTKKKRIETRKTNVMSRMILSYITEDPHYRRSCYQKLPTFSASLYV